MQSEQAQSAWFYDLLGWLDTHKKQAIQGTVAVVVVGLVVSYFFWSRAQKEEAASREFSKLVSRRVGAEEYLKFQNQNRNTAAGANALLVAAQELFAAGKYPDAQTQFEKFRQQYRQSPFVSTASLGIATCLDAEGKADEAIAAYGDLVQRRSGEMAVIQAQFALARLYEARGQFDKALSLYDVVDQAGGTGTFGVEAGICAGELRAQHPELVKAPAPAADLPSLNLNN